MDWEAFEIDVKNSVNDSLYTKQCGSLDDSSPDSDYTGRVFTIGETWLGALYGLDESYYNGASVYLFDTEDEQRQWFERMTGEPLD